MNWKYLMLLAPALCCGTIRAQQVTEKMQELSKQAAKGYFHSAEVNPATGNIEVTYQMKGEKKSRDVDYETYVFDRGLNLVSSGPLKPSTANDKPDITTEAIYAQLGNGKQLSVMSLKLHVVKTTVTKEWNKSKKRYYYHTSSREDVKLTNVDGNSYNGYAAYNNYETGELMILGMSLQDGKRRQVSLLNIKSDLSVNEIPVEMEGMQGLVYSCLLPADPSQVNDQVSDLAEADMVFVFAPKTDKKLQPDYKKYTWLRMDRNGKVKERFTIDCPAPNLAITGHHQDASGAVYLIAHYNSKSKEPFEKRYGESIYIENPAMESGAPNVRMENFEKKMSKEPNDYLAVIKIENGAVASVTSNSIKEMGKLVRTPPKQKKGKAYDGRLFSIQQFEDLPNGDFLISGQKIAYIKPKEAKYQHRAYKELVCLQLDRQGKVQAQYSVVPKTISDKDNTLFPIFQKLIVAPDGKTAYLQLLENKTSRRKDMLARMGQGGTIRYSSNYFPSVVKFDVAGRGISDYSLPGKRKYELWETAPYVFLEKENAIVYVGNDGSKKLWLAKYQMQ